MLSDTEKWLFDLHGYLVLKQAVSAEDVDEMVELCDAWDAMADDDLPEPVQRYRDDSTGPTTARTVCGPDYVSDVFARLVLNREIMRVVLALTDNCPKHLNVCLTRNTVDSDDIPLHGGFTGGIHNPASMYQAANGRIFATFLNAAVSLVDVPEESGFVCIPGSHKSEFTMPPGVDQNSAAPVVVSPSVDAGDVVLFTETLCHGGRRWTRADEPRRTAFIRYSTSYASFSPTAKPIEEFRDRISEELYELKQTSSVHHRKKVVTRLLEEMGERS